jgi:hypothetical protein
LGGGSENRQAEGQEWLEFHSRSLIKKRLLLTGWCVLNSYKNDSDSELFS